MNNENVEYLQKNLFNLGFGEKLQEELKNKIQQNLGEFTLKTEANYHKEKLEATLYFKKSETSGIYFFNKYDTTLKSDFQSEKSQTFYINKGGGVTFKEAYNLLSDNAVHKNLVTKEGEQYKAWLKLDLSQKDENNNYRIERYHQNYGYDLKKVLAEYPIKELNNPDSKEMLIKSLEKGNRQSVTIERDGSEEKFFIRANPKEKTIDVFDKQFKPVQTESIKATASHEQQSTSKDVSQNSSQDVKKDSSKQKDLDKKETVHKPKSRRMSH